MMVVQDFCTVMHMPEVVKDKQLKKKMLQHNMYQTSKGK